MPTAQSHYRLANQPGSLSLECDLAGLRLAGVPLVKETIRGFEPRHSTEVVALLADAYDADFDITNVMGGLDVVAKALSKGDLGRAMVAAVRLRLPELDWTAAARLARRDEQLQKYDPDEPRDWRGRWTAVDGIGLIQPTLDQGQRFGDVKPSSDRNADLGANPPNPVASDAVPSAVDLSSSRTPTVVNSAVLDDRLAGPHEIDIDALDPAAYNGRFHDTVVAAYANYLRSTGQVVQTEVGFLMADGSAGARLDIVAHDPFTGITYGVEVKTGDRPGFTPGQLIVYHHLMIGESVVSANSKGIFVGLPTNVPLPPMPIFQFYQRNGESKYEIRPLDPSKMSRYYRGDDKI